jgi:hypothetical protein
LTYPVQPSLPEAPISINFKIPEIPGAPMLTIRAAQGVELEALSGDVARFAASVGRSLTEFRAGFLAGAGIQADAPQAPSQAPPSQSLASPASYPPVHPQAPQAPVTGGTGAAPTCPHGVKEYKSGVGKTGKPYKRWACPSQDRNNQCKPEWLS